MFSCVRQLSVVDELDTPRQRRKPGSDGIPTFSPSVTCRVYSMYVQMCVANFTVTHHFQINFPLFISELNISVIV